MALIPLNIPAGVYRNGTEYQALGRWLDANLVRWTDGTMRPIGGWQQKSQTAAAAKVRGLHSWIDNSSNRYIAAGTYNKLYVYDKDGAQYDITPAGLTVGNEETSPAVGWGISTYGTGVYGVERPDTGLTIPATTWQMDNFGEYLIACSSDDGKIYEWQLDIVTPTLATVIANAPVNNLGTFVSEERFLFALGAGGNPRKLQWSDREDNTTWTPAATNEAGDIELQTAGTIQQALKVVGQSVILTTTDAHSVTYIGAPYVYGIERLGTNCGSISPRAGASFNGGAVWMGNRNFFLYSGGQVQKLPSEVADYVFSDINRAYNANIFAVTNSRYQEVWWFYVSSESTEVNRYVTWNYQENTWSIGQLTRTAGIDQGVFANPVWCSTDGHMQEHELGNNYGGLTPYAESGPVAIGTGDQVMVVTEMIPDERTQGDVTATFKTRFHPNDTERTYGSYTMSNPTSVRFTGRQVRMRVTGAANSDWRVGVMRLDAVGGGRR